MDKKTVHLAYGKSQVQVDVPVGSLLGVYYPKEVGEPLSEGRILARALSHPIGSMRLRDIVKKGCQIAIITSDISRPCPSDRILPYIVAELEAAGIPDEDVFIVLALGIHRSMTGEEIAQTLSPQMQRRFRVIEHDPQDVIGLGTTSAGTPVEIFRPVVEADMRICLGNLEYHYFAGFSGGAKAVVPGCASRACLSANHAMMVKPEAAGGRLDGNPLRMDLEEAVAMLGVDFILNVIVNSEHRIVGAVAGDLTAAHLAGCELLASRGAVSIPGQADIVIASASGFPKDIDFVQGHKALESAKYFVRQGGILILTAECVDGIGNRIFESWLREQASPEESIERIQREFILGGHKAAAIGLILRRAQIFIISALPEDIVRQGGMRPFSDPQLALEAAMSELEGDSQVIVLPQATSVFPKIEEEIGNSLS